MPEPATILSELTPIITPVLSAGAALTGVAIGNRHAGRREQLQALRTRRDRVVDEYSALLQQANRWGAHHSGSIAFYMKASLDDHMEWVDTDSGRDVREATQAFKVQVTKLQLLAKDKNLLGHVRVLEEGIGTYNTLIQSSLNPKRETFTYMEAWTELERFKSCVASATAAGRRFALAEPTLPRAWLTRVAKRLALVARKALSKIFRRKRTTA